jgi:hypothetical protein
MQLLISVLAWVQEKGGEYSSQGISPHFLVKRNAKISWWACPIRHRSERYPPALHAWFVMFGTFVHLSQSRAHYNYYYCCNNYVQKENSNRLTVTGVSAIAHQDLAKTPSNRRIENVSSTEITPQ